MVDYDSMESFNVKMIPTWWNTVC